MAERDDELDAIVAQLERAGLVETYTDEEGRYRLSADGPGRHRGPEAGDGRR